LIGLKFRTGKEINNNIIKPFGVEMLILECAPLKVLSLISFGANFGGQVHTKFCSSLEWAPVSGRWDWSPRISQYIDRIPSFQKQKQKLIH